MQEQIEQRNREILELEARRIELIKEKLANDTELRKIRAIHAEKLTAIESELQDVNSKLSSVRRQFKLEGRDIRTRKFKLSEDAKKIIIETRGSVCESCGTGEDLSVHHKVPLSHGGTNDASNLEVLCIPCHRELHRVG